MHIRHFQIYVSVQSFEMLHDIYWVFKSLSSKSIFYSLPHLLHQSMHAAKFVNVLLKLFAALHSHQSSHHISAGFADTEIHDKAWKQEGDWLLLLLLGRTCVFTVVQVPSAGTSQEILLERQIFRGLPTSTKSQDMGKEPRNLCFLEPSRGF